ncbi:MAG: hypothetical protein Q9226_003501 [Calogaya cf. arnoldii]
MHDFDATASWGAYLPADYHHLLGDQTTQGQMEALEQMHLMRMSSSSSAETPLTVSPDQLQLSGPSSGYLGHEYTPLTSYTDSPAGHSVAYSNQNSPFDNAVDSDGFAPMNMFPDLGQTGPLESSTDQSFVVQKPRAKSTVAKARANSSAANSPGSPLSKIIGGRVRKAPRKVLGPIEVDPNDPYSVKKGKNTQSARDSRAKKEREKAALETEVIDLSTRVEELQAQVQVWRQRAIDGGWPPGAE